MTYWSELLTKLARLLADKVLEVFARTLWRVDRLLCLFWSVKGTILSLFSCTWNLESGWWLRKIQSFHCYLGERW